jgi:hypothetical protein
MMVPVALLLAAAPVYAEDMHHPGTAPASPGTAGVMPGGVMGQGGAAGMGMGPGAMQPRGMMSMMGPMMGPMMEGGVMPMMGMAEHVEGRLAFIKAELKITDAQQPQWNAFADAVRTNAQTMKDMAIPMTGQEAQPKTLPERLAQHEKMLSTHLENLRRLRSAADPLYAALSEEQKKTADALARPMGMMGMMGIMGIMGMM